MDIAKFDVDAEYYQLDDVWYPAKIHPKCAVEAVKNFQFEEGDVFSSTYPKTGKYI